MTTSEQQAVPVAHFYPDAAAKLGKLLAGSNVVADDARTLVIAAREFWDPREDGSPESRALLAALEAFSSRVPYEDEPAALGESASLPCKPGEGADHVPDVGKLVPGDDVKAQNPAALLAHLKRMPMTEWVWHDASMIFATLAALSTPSEQFAKSSPDAGTAIEAGRVVLEGRGDGTYAEAEQAIRGLMAVCAATSSPNAKVEIGRGLNEFRNFWADGVWNCTVEEVEPTGWGGTGKYWRHFVGQGDTADNARKNAVVLANSFYAAFRINIPDFREKSA